MTNNWPLVQLSEILTKSDEWVNLRPDTTYRAVTVRLRKDYT